MLVIHDDALADAGWVGAMRAAAGHYGPSTLLTGRVLAGILFIVTAVVFGTAVGYRYAGGNLAALVAGRSALPSRDDAGLALAALALLARRNLLAVARHRPVDALRPGIDPAIEYPEPGESGTPQ